MWNVAWDQWESRNDSLYRTPIAGDLSGAILAEYLLGTRGLLPRVKITFLDDVNIVLRASLIERKYWLVVVRDLREVIQDTIIQDEFSDLKSHFRNWVGLS